jgi:dimethylglycine dehydrogenase
MRDYDPRRFGEYATKDWQVIKAKEDYCLRHEIPFPHFNRLAGRPVKPSPLYERLKAKGACMRKCTAMSGHGGSPGKQCQVDTAQREFILLLRAARWFDMVAIESKAVREAAGIMDISAFSKIEVAGPDAHAFLDRLTPNRLPQKPGASA